MGETIIVEINTEGFLVMGAIITSTLLMLLAIMFTGYIVWSSWRNSRDTGIASAAVAALSFQILTIVINWTGIYTFI